MKKNMKATNLLPTFETEEEKYEFLQGQLDLLDAMSNGESTWEDLNEFRVSYGCPSATTETLRRTFQQLMVYNDLGVVGSPEEIPIIGESDHEGMTINYEKGEATSEKIVKLSEADVKDPLQLLAVHGFDPDEWEVKQANNTRIRRETIHGPSYAYASRVTVKPKNSVLANVEKVKKLFEDFEAPKLKMPKNNFKTDEYLMVPLYDLHFGRLADTEDFEKYDLEAEKNRIIEHVQKYIAKFKDRKFKTVYLIIGQDFLNSSFTGYTSSQSHLQSNAIDFRTMFKAGSELLISIIDMFAETCNNLTVVGSLGNHDVAEEVALFSLIKAYYRNVDTITVDDGTAPRKYYEVGNACVGLGHLDKEKDRTYGLMQVEARDIYARTKSHIFVAGHLHHFEVNSKQGIEVFRVPAICPPDRWTVEQGYVQNEPKTMCFIFDDEQGLTETHFMYL